jgi:hypothetical protein
MRVSSVPWSYRDRSFILVDTPAFDDEGTTVTLEHLKKQLKKWMKDA